MNDKERVQALVSGVFYLEHLCKEGEPDDRKLEKQLEHVANLARDCSCGQYSAEDDSKGFG